MLWSVGYRFLVKDVKGFYISRFLFNEFRFSSKKVQDVVNEGSKGGCNFIFVMESIGLSGFSMVVNNGEEIMSFIKSRFFVGIL